MAAEARHPGQAQRQPPTITPAAADGAYGVDAEVLSVLRRAYDAAG